MDIQLRHQLLCSTINFHNRSRFYGNADVIAISTLSLIYEILNSCLEISHECNVKLNTLALKLIHESPDICNLRGQSIMVDGDNSMVTISTALNTPPTIEDYDCYNYNYEEFNFNSNLFTTGYSDSGNNNPKFLRIKSLPLLGSLMYNGVPVIIDQIILLSDISNLTYDLGLEYSSAINITFNFQIGNDNENTLFSNTATFYICVPELTNIAPTVDDESGSLGLNNCRTFIYDDFTNNFNDVNEGDIPFETQILTLPSIGNLSFNGNSISVPFTFNIENVNQLTFCLPENYSVINGVIYSYDEPLNNTLSNLLSEGYVIDNVENGTYNLIKINTTTISNTTNIYTFFDTSSMQQQDGLDAKIALQSWYDNYCINNPNYTGNLYIIPLNNEQWVRFGVMPWIGQFGPITTSGEWGNIGQLPPNINTEQWVPDTDVLVLAFADEANSAYHGPTVAEGFSDPNPQPRTAWEYNHPEFITTHANYNFFKGLIYPIVQDVEAQGGALVLQAMAAIEGSTLTQAQIDAYNTTVDVDILLTENPYSSMEALKDYGWSGIFDKTSPASAVFNSTTFGNDLNSFLESDSTTEIITQQIVGTLVSNTPITFDFQTSDNDESNQLFSNVATYTIIYDNVNNLPPSQVGDGDKTINNDTIITFTRNDFTNDLDPSYLDPENDPAFKLRIESLPLEGTLTLNDVAITVNQEILFTDIDAGLFKFIPNPNINSHTVKFDFKVSDTGSNEFIG